MTRYVTAYKRKDIYGREQVSVLETQFICDNCGRTYTVQGMSLYPHAGWRVSPDDAIGGARHTCAHCMKGVS